MHKLADAETLPLGGATRVVLRLCASPERGGRRGCEKSSFCTVASVNKGGQSCGELGMEEKSSAQLHM